MRHHVRLVSVLALLTAAVPAQDPAAIEAEVAEDAARALVRFARTAERNHVGPRARRAYDLILDHYDVDHRRARRALGYRRSGDGWKEPPPDERGKWEDEADNEERYEVVEEWYDTATKLAEIHREAGRKLREAGAEARATYHFERAVSYNPLDAASHQALGHEEYEGFWGTEEQVAFVQRMKEMERKALELARKEYDVEPIPEEEFPEAVRQCPLEFKGARSEHFTFYTRGDQKNADDLAMWGERALDYLIYMFGEKRAKRYRVVRRNEAWSYRVFVWTPSERKTFLEANPQVVKGRDLDAVLNFANITWKSPEGPAEMLMELTPAQMQDAIIGKVWTMALGHERNDALMEGVYHAATWLLKSTIIFKHGALPEGTVGDKELELPEGANWWLRAIRDQALAGTDWPIAEVPREPLSRFRNDVRLKTWSFMLWCMARYPQRWWEFVSDVPHDKRPFPTEVEEIGEEVFERPLAEVEADWREWARGDSGVAAATGYGPPLLPPAPNDAEIAGLERINQIREVAELSPCALDAEASIACQEHAEYLVDHPEHHKWPEAHEQDPAKEGFTPRGMRAGMRSVIAWTEGGSAVDFATRSLDLWIGTVYHRFPLLEPNIRRFGYALEEGNGYTFTVLDMGSLQEPYDPETSPKWIEWPVDGMVDVPRQFHGIEHPNPLGDQPPAQQDITRTGYPVSLQLSKNVAKQIVSASISLNVLGRRDRVGDRVDCWIHTPAKPLLKRQEIKNVVFAIPKAHLEPRTRYQVTVDMRTNRGNLEPVTWSFTTGRQMQGLARRLQIEK